MLLRYKETESRQAASGRGEVTRVECGVKWTGQTTDGRRQKADAHFMNETYFITYFIMSPPGLLTSQYSETILGPFKQNQQTKTE